MELITTNLRFGNKCINPNQLFLGKWCLDYPEDVKNSHKVVPYHWDDRNKAYIDSLFLNDLYLKILPKLSSRLNQIHKINYLDRSWNMIFGLWLLQFITVTYDRYNLIKSAELISSDLYTEFYYNNPKNFIPDNCFKAVLQFYSQNWNHVFISEIIKKVSNVKFHYCDTNLIKSIDDDIEQASNLSKRTISLKFIKDISKSFVSLILKSRFDKSYCYIFSSTRLNLIELFSLRMKLKGDIIFEPIPKKYNKLLIDHPFRNQTVKLFDAPNEFESLLEYLIPRWIPKVCLENFYLQNKSVQLSTEKYKKTFLFTTLSHFYNDQFKFLMAQETEKGSKLLIAQHGGKLNKYNASLFYEEQLPDLFLKSGVEGIAKESNAFLGAIWPRMRYGRWKKDGNALIVTSCLPKYCFELRAMPLASQMNNYLENLFTLYEKLPFHILNKTIVRLYKADYNYNQYLRWKDRFPEANIDRGFSKISKVVTKCRIVICTYNASSYLETLAANIPTIIYWDDNYWEILEESKYDFMNLEKVKIFHKSEESALEHLNKYWNDISSWWLIPEVQKARVEFCNKYVRFNPSLIRSLVKFLK